MNLPDLTYFTQIINSYLPEPQATLLNGIVFGTSIKGQFDLYQAVKTAGLLHIVVLSGMNITILAVIIMKLTSFISKKTSLLIVSVFILIFAIIVGPQAPIIRAIIMCYVTIVAFMFERSIKPIVALFVSAITIGIFWPQMITSLSFLLSFFATLGIVIINQSDNPKSRLRNEISELVVLDIKTSLSAQIMTAPIIMMYFKELSLVSPIATLLVAPLIGPLMILTFITVLSSSINWYLGLIPGFLCYGVVTMVLFVIDLLSRIPLIFIKF